MKKFFVAVILALVCFVANAQPKHIYQLSLDNVKVEVRMSSANSVGGRAFEAQIINCSKKTIKYIWITEAAVDNFCNFAPCKYSREYMQKIKITGPIEGNTQLLNKYRIPHKFIHNYHTGRDLHYNYSATKAILVKCKIEFTDGSVAEYINKDLLNYLAKEHYDGMKACHEELYNNDSTYRQMYDEFERDGFPVEYSMEEAKEHIMKIYFN